MAKIKDIEAFACTECGTLFIPGEGPDNIHEKDSDEELVYPAYRKGKCPVCEAENPDMTQIIPQNI